MPKAVERIKKESRKHARIAVYLKVKETLASKLKDYTIYTHNLSISGMMVVLKPPLSGAAPITAGEEVMISCALSSKSGELNIPSEVVWIKEQVLTPEDEPVSCMGIRFISLTEPQKNVIDDFLKGEVEKESKSAKKTCRDCSFFQNNPGSKYAYCKLHRMTVLNSSENLTMSFNQIYLYPCKEFKPNE